EFTFALDLQAGQGHRRGREQQQDRHGGDQFDQGKSRRSTTDHRIHFRPSTFNPLHSHLSIPLSRAPHSNKTSDASSPLSVAKKPTDHAQPTNARSAPH